MRWEGRGRLFERSACSILWPRGWALIRGRALIQRNRVSSPSVIIISAHDSLCLCGVTHAGQCRGHLSFRLFLCAMSLQYLRSIRKLKIRLFTVWNVFLLYCCFFGWQGRRYNTGTSYHSVFDVILVQLNEWIPVLLFKMPLKICFVLT